MNALVEEETLEALRVAHECLSKLERAVSAAAEACAADVGLDARTEFDLALAGARRLRERIEGLAQRVGGLDSEVPQ